MRLLNLQDQGVDERTGGGSGAVVVAGAVGGAVGAVAIEIDILNEIDERIVAVHFV